MENIDVCDIAKWFFDNNGSVRMRTFDGNAKLQKLIYYSQAMYSAVYGEPLFADEIEAWANGPVVKRIYARKNNNNFDNMEKPSISDEIIRILKTVNSVYGVLTTDELIEQTHIEAPWKDLEQLAINRYNPEIKFETIKEYYKGLKDIYDAYEGYDFDSEIVETINNNNFVYNKNEMELTDEDINYLYNIGLTDQKKSFNLIKSEGKLVLY